MTQLNHKKVLITGGSSGIGYALVESLLASDASISVLTRQETSELEKFCGPNFHIYYGDVTQKEDTKQWIIEAQEYLGEINTVINNAGVMYYMELLKGDYQQMKQMIEVNCLGFINLLSDALPILKTSTCPHWINITSDAGKQPFPGLAVYSGSKAFVEFCSRAMRQELIDENIKVTNIQPGNVRTDLHQKSTDKEATSKYATKDEGQYLNTSDIVEAVYYALSTPHNVAVNEVLVEPLTESI